MIQVDIFWTFAIGACFAALSSKRLVNESSAVVNSYFVYNLCFLGLFFAPSGVYLLWEFPGWESMWMLDRATVSASLASLFASTNMLFGILGFVSATYFIKQGKPLRAHTLWVINYVIMFGILGFGYRRFLYAGTEEDWAAGVKYPLASFFECNVFYTLLGMGVVIIPGLYYPILLWPKYCGNTSRENRAVLKHIVVTFAISLVIGVAAYCGWVHFFATSAEKQYLVMNDFDFEYRGTLVKFGYYSPVVAFVIAEVAFMSLVFFPFLLQGNVSRNKKQKIK
jgi:hypothetical protein